jgi:hypothetical protein
LIEKIQAIFFSQKKKRPTQDRRDIQLKKYYGGQLHHGKKKKLSSKIKLPNNYMKIYSFQWNRGKIVDCFKHTK